MTRSTNARLAGFLFLCYIATAYLQVVLFTRATRGGDVTARLAAIGQHVPLVRLEIVLSLVTFVEAVVLATALYGLTREVDRDLAALALACRIGEGVLATVPVTSLGLLWLATGGGGSPMDTAATNLFGAFLLKVGSWRTLSASTCFALGSTIFAWLLLRGRIVARWLAWTGVGGSALLVMGLPLQMAGYIGGRVTDLLWIPVAVFEVVLGVWLMARGDRALRPNAVA